MNKDLKIDVQELDKEWMLLPQLYAEYSEKAEMVETELRKAKMRYDIRKAEISKHIRGNSKSYASEYGVSSLTEGFISTLIDSDAEIKAIQSQILALDRNKRLYATAVRGLEMKRDALKNLTALFQAQYFSVESVSRTGGQYEKAQEEFEKRDIRKEIKDQLRQNRKQTGEMKDEE